MARRTKEEALATRDLILDTAERVFQRHGVSRTSLQEIAQQAGLTRGAIYWHFQNKADVFDAMLQRVTLPMVARLNGQSKNGVQDPLGHLRQNIATVFHQIVHDLQVRRVFEIASHQVEYTDELQAVRDRHISGRAEHVADMERMLTQAMACGQLAPGTPTRGAAEGLHALLDGLMSNWLLDPKAFDLEQVGIQALDAYLGGLALPRAAST